MATVASSQEANAAMSGDKQETTPKASSQEPETLKLQACKWAICSTEDNMKMWMHMALTTLYQIYVGQCAAHNDLRVTATPEEHTKTDGPWRIFAVREMKAKTLLLVPWNAQLVSGEVSRPKDAIPIRMTAKPDKEEATNMVFWLRAKNVPRTLASSQDRASVLVPFWTLAAKPVQGQTTSENNESKEETKDDVPNNTLTYQKMRLPVPTPGPMAKGVRVQKANIHFEVPVLTNMETINKGDRLIVNKKAPVDMTELENEDDEED